MDINWSFHPSPLLAAPLVCFPLPFFTSPPQQKTPHPVTIMNHLLSLSLLGVAALSNPLPQPGPNPNDPNDPFPPLPPDLTFDDIAEFPTFNGTGATMLRFGCHQLVIDRIDPLVNPRAVPSPHQHQIVGGDAFDAYMPLKDIAKRSSCTGCSYSDDFSNYWTSNLYFRARNGSYKRVKQIPNNLQFNDTFTTQTDGGLTAYYVSPGQGEQGVKAFKPGFRMFFGDAALRARPTTGFNLSRQTCFRCYTGPGFEGDNLPPCQDPAVDSWGLPQRKCFGIRSNILFPTCWDGVTLDTPDHKSHVAYPLEGPQPFSAFRTAEACPPSHPVKIPQVMLEIVWDTTPFNDPELWPADGSQPFVLSTGDRSGYSQHADYVFGWKGQELQKAMNAGCAAANCPGIKVQSLKKANKCKVKPLVKEKSEGWLSALPGGIQAQ
ncbi:hypothetical protein QC764_0083480 [Podospora pseudoanserina]|uniref:DUF1996 domain-containing protein n=1 Tax=Podospora pseudoanserina TaxID=2609844 RepID=A0ABR0I727_9PEZI|nr:hypothetical protein QC764_0083480 [Podospora pseudoanserina]